MEDEFLASIRLLAVDFVEIFKKKFSERVEFFYVGILFC